ncbi:GATA transcription factor 5-like, partial [Momordica charantia]|uniref:GATA transcription factor 5-like n=1 Tax=Momordica charantia TaxID=3673 RepID=A0A6J1BV04_MOMCH
MEEGDLKMRVVKDTSFKSSSKVYLDEFWSPSSQIPPSSSSSDNFFVDQLLNFSNEEDGFIEEEEEEEKPKHSISVSAPLQESDENSNHSSTNSSEDAFWSVSSGDFEDLEWLSHLVSDSSQEYSAAAAPCSVFFPETTHQPLPKFGSNLKTQFPSKPRSKRAKVSGRVWSTSLITSSSSAKKPRKSSTPEGSGRVQ